MEKPIGDLVREAMSNDMFIPARPTADPAVSSEDIRQQTVANLLAAKHRWNQIRDTSQFLRAAARNCRNSVQRRARRMQSWSEIYSPEASSNGLKRLEEWEVWSILLGGLSAEELRIVGLRYCGRSQKEIASLLGLSPATICKRIQAIAARLDAKHLSEWGLPLRPRCRRERQISPDTP